MKSVMALGLAAVLVSACVIVVDGSDLDDDVRTDFWGDYDDSPQEATPIDEALSDFMAVSAAAGSNVTLKKGASHAIKLDARAAASTRYTVKDGKLSIGCRKHCNGRRGAIQVIVPEVDSLSASSGASVKVASGFEKVEVLTVAASSGANIDALSLAANVVNARASSGGSVRVHADQALNARASSGGSVRYAGSPSDVDSAKSSGGSVRGD